MVYRFPAIRGLPSGVQVGWRNNGWRESRMWTPLGGQAWLRNRVGGSLVRYCRMFGLLMQHSVAAGPYGVREIGSKSASRAHRPSVIHWFFRPRLVDRLPLPRSLRPAAHTSRQLLCFRFSPFAARSGGSANPG